MDVNRKQFIKDWVRVYVFSGNPGLGALCGAACRPHEG
jgi:hypothetical protein